MSNTDPKMAQNALSQYLKGVRSELSHIVWPTRKETIRLTSLVIGGSVAIGVLLALFDFLANKGLEYLLTLR